MREKDKEGKNERRRREERTLNLAGAVQVSSCIENSHGDRKQREEEEQDDEEGPKKK